APSSVIESGLGFASKLSPTQSESNSGSASTSRARVISCSTVVAPNNTPRWGSVKPNVSLCVVIGSLLQVPFEGGFHDEEIVLTLRQDQLRALQAQIGRTHHPHEGQLAGEQLLEARVDPEPLRRVQRAATGDDQPIHLGSAVARTAIRAEERVEAHRR